MVDSINQNLTQAILTEPPNAGRPPLTSPPPLPVLPLACGRVAHALVVRAMIPWASPQALVDTIVPPEYQGVAARVMLAWCVACWLFGAYWMLRGERASNRSKKLR